MKCGDERSSYCGKSDMSDEIMREGKHPPSMAKEDRKRRVLEFLNEYRLALPQRAIFRNLCFRYGITFGYSSVDNYLDEFVEEGRCRRVDPDALEDRELADISSGRQNRAYYIITDEGIEYIQNND